jgi:hypothetical protein
MGFLGALGDALSSQFGLVSNDTSSLDAVIDGQQTKYGSLGQISQQFDQSARRSYMEEGYLRTDPYQIDPRQFEVLWQQPSATVLVKKRMFSSVAQNYRPDFMDVDETLFYKAMCILYQNKCAQIAALEQLSKIQQVTAAVGSITQQLVPAIITLADTVNNGYATGGGTVNSLFTGGGNPFTTQDATGFFQTVDRLRVLSAYNQTAQYTTWISDPTNLYQTTFGPGTGVIEITNFTNLNTSTSLDINSSGNFSFSVVDPYQAMLITDWDIEIALSNATNSFYSNSAVTFGVQAANQTITDFQNMLNQARASRNASPISFQVNPNTIFGQPVTATIDRLGLEIPFTYNALAGLIGLNSAVTVPNEYLQGSSPGTPNGIGAVAGFSNANPPGNASGIGAIAGYDGLATSTLPIGPDSNIQPLFGNSELSLFTQIILSTFQQLQLLSSTSQNLVSQNGLTNYARKKLRFLFSGKLIIQPMDVVHIYMNSRSQLDNKILAGLQSMFSGVGILGNVTQNNNNIVNGLDTLLNPSGNLSLQAEKAVYVGPDFPNYLWLMMRSQFVTEIEGTHVFAGVVDSATDTWNDGRFVMNISGQDNTYYFKQGKVNFNPGVDAFNGLVFDPLTPFKTNFDSFTGNATAAVTSQNSSNTPQLLDENMYTLGGTASESMVKFKQGALAGEKATQGNIIQDQIIDPTTQRLTKIFYAPDGLVYRWKQGIGIFAQSGSIQTINDPNLVGNPNIYAQPFAGLDVMNVLSLLITGVPYNYTTYFKATGSLSGFSGDPNSKQSNVQTFLDSLRTTLSKNNALWGNFIPFKNLTLNTAALSQMMAAQVTVNNINADLDQKLHQFSNLQNTLTTLGAINVLTTSRNIAQTADPTVAAQISSFRAQAQNLQQSINSQISALQTAQNASYAQITAGSYSNSGLAQGLDASDPTTQQIVRREMNFLTRRMSYDVRANEDKNLFIVDDYYDADYDIAAFNQALTDGIKLYSNDFTSVDQNIMNVAKLLNLEVFADSQGHIRARPPQYNKMPSSTFYRMLYLKQVMNIQIFPEFLNNLFTNQLTSLQQQVEVIEDNIRLLCAILGQYPSLDLTGDDTAATFISGQNVTSGMSGTFIFISDPTDTITDINLLLQQATQDEINGTVAQGFDDYGDIAAAGTQTKQLFSNAQRYTVLLQALQAQNQTAGSISGGGTNTANVPSTGVFQNSVVQSLITRIQQKSGQTLNSTDYLTSAGPNQPVEVDTGQTIDIFKVTNDLTTYIGQWQQQVKLFYQTLKNASEFQSLDDDDSISNAIGVGGTFGNQYIPEVYEHMIEDETYDDYGPGAGGRYVIHAYQIKNLTISENPPPYTTVQVEGTLSPFFDENNGGGGPQQFNNFPGGGNGLVTAIAIDYDMWRNYGFKDPSVIKVPFFQDPVNQCGPYAAMVLTRNRSKILQGNLTISGNEYMQVGEVIYLEDRNLLFYINNVRHNYTEGALFTTTLELTYGHSIGDYIPTFLDTIGKIIIKNQDITNTIIQRQDSSTNEQNIGIVQLNGSQPNADNVLYTGSENNNTNSYSSSNQTVINNILYGTGPMINQNGAFGNNTTAAVELRLYHDSNNAVSSTLTNMANKVMSDLTGGDQGPQMFSGANNSQTPYLPSSSVSIVTISLDDETDHRSPSQQALNGARAQVQNFSMNQGSPSPSNPIDDNDNTSAATISATNAATRTALSSYIIDCWVVLTVVPTTVSNAATQLTV